MDLTGRLLMHSDWYAETLYRDHHNSSDFGALDTSSDASSGYHSSGTHSDVTTLSSEGSRGSVHPPITDTTEPEVMRFRSAQPLCDALTLILSTPELCDVTFLVGPDRVPVHGVKAILGTRSRKFFDLILKYRNMAASEDKRMDNCCNTAFGKTRFLSERLVIPVNKYDAEVFRCLVQFVHSGTVSVTEDTAAGLYCGACQFELPDLSRACLKYIERRVQSGNFHKLLSAARNYSHHKAAKSLYDKIYEILNKRYSS